MFNSPAKKWTRNLPRIIYMHYTFTQASSEVSDLNGG
jgi:hypothetical protein